MMCFAQQVQRCAHITCASVTRAIVCCPQAGLIPCMFAYLFERIRQLEGAKVATAPSPTLCSVCMQALANAMRSGSAFVF